MSERFFFGNLYYYGIIKNKGIFKWNIRFFGYVFKLSRVHIELLYWWWEGKISNLQGSEKLHKRWFFSGIKGFPFIETIWKLIKISTTNKLNRIDDYEVKNNNKIYR